MIFLQQWGFELPPLRLQQLELLLVGVGAAARCALQPAAGAVATAGYLEVPRSRPSYCSSCVGTQLDAVREYQQRDLVSCAVVHADFGYIRKVQDYVLLRNPTEFVSSTLQVSKLSPRMNVVRARESMRMV